MKIAVLTSGGVDSSLALSLLKEAGHEVAAFYCKVWLEEDGDFAADCPWKEDVDYVEDLCARLKVPLRIVPLQGVYYDRIVQYVVQELKKGDTPSPDLLCNSYIKFGAFADQYAQDFDAVASGHYAKVLHHPEGSQLLRAADPVKDQTYFLSRLSQSQLAKLCFPLADLQKQEVRRLAADRNLPSSQRKDSQGLCFLGKIPYPEFIAHYLGEHPGKVIDRSSKTVLGAHRGYWFYTIGQRQGLGLGGGPWYIVEKDVQKNLIYVAHATMVDDYSRHAFSLHATNWIPHPPEDGPVEVKVRHSPVLAAGTCQTKKIAGEFITEIVLDTADRGIASGQFAVLYRKRRCLGSGRIVL